MAECGYGKVHFGTYGPEDIFPYMYEDEPQPHWKREAQRKAKVRAMTEANPRFADIQAHVQRVREEAYVGEMAMLCLFKYRHKQPIYQKDYDNLKAASLLYNQNFEPLVPEVLLVRVARRVVLEKEV